MKANTFWSVSLRNGIHVSITRYILVQHLLHIFFVYFYYLCWLDSFSCLDLFFHPANVILTFVLIAVPSFGSFGDGMCVCWEWCHLPSGSVTTWIVWDLKGPFDFGNSGIVYSWFCIIGPLLLLFVFLETEVGRAFLWVILTLKCQTYLISYLLQGKVLVKKNSYLSVFLSFRSSYLFVFIHYYGLSNLEEGI